MHYSNSSVTRIMTILEYISKSSTALTIAEMSRELKIPKTSVFDIVHTLCDNEYLELEDDRFKTYKLGIKLFELGGRFLVKADLHNVARPILERAMLETGETVFLVVEYSGELVYLDKVIGSSSVLTGADLGSRNPMHCTGVGKALLATFSQDYVHQIICKHGLTKKTSKTITDESQLYNELKIIRERGYSIDDEENEYGVYCVAAPIRGISEKPLAAISIASLAAKMTEDRKSLFSKIIIESALNISKKLGYSGDSLYDLKTLIKK
ncbi:Transcriptional regulator, IclR family [uncultured Spirochaetota bacterium]|jgi:DNA-binding IclR family transcriptional regulator|uniref:Transcriptional regulator, IclR family n=1 Tax=uncultured Spirochaetota bacterium TaxID=460511 RepID=A0A652ZZR8_9SPIR|nr:Transcriptional regulator, IclR family [uncultured Spirochaetota bacterium]